MCAKIIDIANVPPSPNTGFMSKPVYNPLNEDFTHSWDGVAYTIPAGETRDFPEFLARHLAKHLAKKIVSTRWEIKIRKDAIGQITPDTAKAVPLIEVQQMMEALLSGKKETFEKIEKMAPEPPKVATIVAPPTPVEEAKETIKEEFGVKEEVKEPEVKSEVSFKCPQCEFLGKNANGLRLHSRKHK